MDTFLGDRLFSPCRRSPTGVFPFLEIAFCRRRKAPGPGVFETNLTMIGGDVATLRKSNMATEKICYHLCIRPDIEMLYANVDPNQLKTGSDIWRGSIIVD